MESLSHAIILGAMIFFFHLLNYAALIFTKILQRLVLRKFIELNEH